MKEIHFGLIREGGDDKERVEKVVHQIEYLLKQIVDGEECDFVFFRDR